MPDDRQHKSTSYRFDAATLDLIEQLREALRDPATGQRRTATDVLRLLVREAARKHRLHPAKESSQ